LFRNTIRSCASSPFFVLYRAFAQDRIVLQTGVLFDGKGAVLKNQRIVIEGGRIVSVGVRFVMKGGKVYINLAH
jgi:formylmethanofuran dehydrogenase subunit C